MHTGRVVGRLGGGEERFRTIFEQGRFGMALVGTDLRVMQTNAALCEMLGYTAADLTTMRLGQLTATGNGEPDVELAGEVFADGGVYRQEHVFVAKSGPPVSVALTVSAVRTTDDERYYGIAMVEDITQRRRVEHALRQAQNLEGLWLLAGGVAHNFNNAVAVICGYTELLIR